LESGSLGISLCVRARSSRAVSLDMIPFLQ
jgi:hypothetical protein